MIVSVSWLESQFQQFNTAYFGGGLPLPILGLCRSRTRLGYFSCKRARRLLGTKLYDFTIKLTTYYDMTERQAQNVLLHEMIHYSIAYTGLKDTAPHGIVFKGMAEKLNRKYGWEIKAMTTTKGWKLSSKAEQKVRRKRSSSYLVLALEMEDGKHYLSVVNPKFSTIIDRQIRGVRQIQNYGWYSSRDTYFDSFPQVRSLRGRSVTVDLFEEKLGEMQQVFL